MFATIRKHQSWLFAFIIAAVIVSFVIYFTPTAGSGRRGSLTRASFGTIDGKVITRKMFMEAYTEAHLSFFLRYGTWPDKSAAQFGFNSDKETRSRLLLIQKLKELNFRADQAAVAQWIVDHFTNPKQPGSAVAIYEGFVKVELRRRGILEGDFQRFIGHELGINHLAALAGMAGKMVTPREAASLYRDENEKIEAEVVMFSVTNFLESVVLEPAAMGQFYTNQQSFYRVPERLQVDYVRWDITNYWTQADQIMAKNTNLAAEIDREYLSRGPNFFTDTNKMPMTPDAAKAKLRSERRQAAAIMAARREATKFATELFDLTPIKADNLKSLAALKGLTVGTTDAFTEDGGPRTINVGSGFAETAFKLTPERPYSSALPAEDGVFVIAIRQRIPSEVPPMTNIIVRVTADFRQYQARVLARQAGTNFYTLLTNAVAQGKSFKDVCAEAKVVPLLVPAFSPSTRSPLLGLDERIDLRTLQMAVSSLPVGKNSEIMSSRDGSFVAWVKSRSPVDEGELKEKLPTFMASLRQSRQYGAFEEWFRKQADLAHLDMGKEEAAEPTE